MIVPAVNYGHIPAGGNDTDLSEERRLFYVALTRTKKTLELHVVKTRPPSIFMEGLGNLRKAAQASREAFAIPLNQWSAAEAVAVVEVYRYLDRYVDLWSGIEASQQRHLAQWMLAANLAWEKKSRPPLPRELERRLTHLTKPDEAKVEACAQKLGVLHKLRENAAPEEDGQRRRYDPKKGGQLARGTRVWHELHGPGRVTHGGTGSLGIIEVAFDKGRTGKFVMERVVLDLSA